MLTDPQRTLLHFEEAHWRVTGGRKEHLIRETLAMTVGQYYQRLNVLTWSPDAEAEYPQLIHRLQRRAEALRRERDARLLPRSA